MKCAIMQPTWLPWAGYFALMQQVDHFVFLDDVAFNRRSWQSRNRILLNGKTHWLTLPVQKMPRGTSIAQMQLDSAQNWRAKQSATIAQAYAKAPHGEAVLQLLEPVLADESLTNLVALNISAIAAIASKLGIETHCARASQLQCDGARSAHLLAICKQLGASHYVSPPGSAEYLQQDGFANNDGGVHLSFFKYEPAVYTQINATAFVSHLSIIDVIANIGFDGAREYIMQAEII